MEYTMTRITDVNSDFKGQGQGYKVTSSVWRMFARNSTENSHMHQNWQESNVRATDDVAH